MANFGMSLCMAALAEIVGPGHHSSKKMEFLKEVIKSLEMFPTRKG